MGIGVHAESEVRILAFLFGRHYPVHELVELPRLTVGATAEHEPITSPYRTGPVVGDFPLQIIGIQESECSVHH